MYRDREKKAIRRKIKQQKKNQNIILKDRIFVKKLGTEKEMGKKWVIYERKKKGNKERSKEKLKRNNEKRK